MEEVVYFELDNQFGNLGCPNVEPFVSWVDDWRRPDSFLKTEWVKQNKLCVSLNIEPTPFSDTFVFRITAPKSWVEKNCPELLTKYTKFIRTPDDNGIVKGKLGLEFLPYSEENIGIEYLAYRVVGGEIIWEKK